MNGGLISNYYDKERIQKMAETKSHRDFVGGLWDDIGRLSIKYLIDHGLTPGTKVVDVGCGCLRVGLHLVRFLEKNHYFGIDISEELISAGYDVELANLGLQHKLARENLLCDGEFRFDQFPGPPVFGVAFAQSVFTHLPSNHIRLCLKNLEEVTRPGSRLYATVFLVPDSCDWSEPFVHQRGGVTTYPAQDPYHYTEKDLRRFADRLPWRFKGVSDWNHPRDQAIAVFERSRR